MSGPRRIAFLISSAFACALAAAPAQAQRLTTSDRPLVSGNVTPLATLPGVHPVGARIRGNYMYVTGVEGLTVFDISDPELPLPAGALPLPHFENEDVDLGGDTLLISNDPSEGVGVVYVVDISDPRRPALAGGAANGVIDFCQGCFGLGLEEALPPGTGHTISCIPGPQGACQYAWAAGTGQGVAIFDLSDRGNPRFVKEWRPEITGWTTHDVQIDGEGYAWVVGADGSAAYDIADPVNPRMVMRTDPAVKNGGVTLPGFLPPSVNPDEDDVVPLPEPFNTITVGGKGDQPIDFIHHDSLRFGGQDSDAPTATRGARQAARRPSGVTYPRGGTSDVVGIVEEDYNRPTCEGAGSFQTWRIRGKTLYMEDMWATELQSLSKGSGYAPLTGLCSAHYFDEREGLTANAWYEEGTRFLDVSDPANIRQVGYWVPTKGETWSALFAPTDPDGEIVYALDFTRGIDVLRIDRGRTGKTRRAPVRRTWVRRARSSRLRTARTGYSKAGRFGYVCRRPTRRAAFRWR